ncbi:helix-turn-helix transcriptional regulator [Bacillus daqingensis]|uniref:Helix-turn-helix transcriptional regulator n=1 Tax=Bacillus daqingensis TaxID=872396 RepID=A0ABV9NXF5_9BACI
MKVNLNRVKQARQEANLSQQKLAEQVQVTRQTISLIEVGKYNPTINLCIAICKALNKRLDDLFWPEDE